MNYLILDDSIIRAGVSDSRRRRRPLLGAAGHGRGTLAKIFTPHDRKWRDVHIPFPGCVISDNLMKDKFVQQNRCAPAPTFSIALQLLCANHQHQVAIRARGAAKREAGPVVVMERGAVSMYTRLVMVGGDRLVEDPVFAPMDRKTTTCKGRRKQEGHTLVQRPGVRTWSPIRSACSKAATVTWRPLDAWFLRWISPLCYRK